MNKIHSNLSPGLSDPTGIRMLHLWFGRQNVNDSKWSRLCNFAWWHLKRQQTPSTMPECQLGLGRDFLSWKPATHLHRKRVLITGINLKYYLDEVLKKMLLPDAKKMYGDIFYCFQLDQNILTDYTSLIFPRMSQGNWFSILWTSVFSLL